MSTKAISWALEIEGLGPMEKLVLIAMCDSASDTGCSFSANSTLCKITGIVKEQTISSIQQRLCSARLIADTGRRIGATKRVKVFQIHPDACKVEPDEELMAIFSMQEESDAYQEQMEIANGQFEDNQTESQTNHPSEGGLNPPRILPESSPNPPRILPLGVRPYIEGTMNSLSIERGTKDLPVPVQKWNQQSGLPKIRAWTPARSKKLKARMKDTFFAMNWDQAIAKVAASEFCNGNNQRKWIADFDWFLRPDTVAKIMEGKYDKRNGHSDGELTSEKWFDSWTKL